MNNEVEIFSLQLAHEKVEFNAGGFFPINYTLIFSVSSPSLRLRRRLRFSCADHRRRDHQLGDIDPVFDQRQGRELEHDYYDRPYNHDLLNIVLPALLNVFETQNVIDHR